MIDSHIHVFNIDQSDFEKNSVRYLPRTNAFYDDYVSIAVPYGINGCLIVQPSFLKSDNKQLLDILGNTFEKKTKVYGVAVVSPKIPFEELQKLHNTGIEGIRFNLFRTTFSPGEFRKKNLVTLLRSLNELKMHIEIHVESERLPRFLEAIAPIAGKIVIDHFMLPEEGKKGFILKTPAIYYEIERSFPVERIWVKSSAAYRVIPFVPHSEAVKNCCELAENLVSILGKSRILWGSDWPHTQNWEKVEGGSVKEKFQTIMNARDLWTKKNTLFDPEKSFFELLGSKNTTLM